jgi:hypothetical protein
MLVACTHEAPSSCPGTARWLVPWRDTILDHVAWTYYQQIYPNGIWLLFREDEHRQQIFHFQDGWQPTDELLYRRAHGEIDSSDIIEEQKVEDLIRSLAVAGG